MEKEKNKILIEVAGYYSSKLSEFGSTPKGVDWNGEVSQVERFAQLCKIIDMSKAFSLNDLGCGYGALFEYLKTFAVNFEYLGIDVSGEMIAAAKKKIDNDPRARFLVASEPDKSADFGVASGIFNVRLGRSDDEWIEYLTESLEVLDKTSRKGFSFNCLTSYSDADKKRDYLYYADPMVIFDICKRKFSRNVALLHDYGLYEFTILVRKDL
jgi:SAM-dependent methyltransferase